MDPTIVQTVLNDRSSGLAEKIGREIGKYTVAPLSVSGNGQSEKLRFCGSGSLVSVGETAYILTAYHVWKMFEGSAD
jgi:hypothetical protein